MKQVYRVYISDTFVELRSLEGSDFVKGRFICSQSNYENILEFATNLAQNKQMPLKNYISTDE